MLAKDIEVGKTYLYKVHSKAVVVNHRNNKLEKGPPAGFPAFTCATRGKVIEKGRGYVLIEKKYKTTEKYPGPTKLVPNYWTWFFEVPKKTIEKTRTVRVTIPSIIRLVGDEVE